MKLLKVLFIAVVLFTSQVSHAAPERRTQNLVIVTLDGMRWQEVFRGVDETLFKSAPNSTALANDFRADTPQESRNKLMPFLWNTIATQGQIYGNRDADNFVNVKNPYWVSYPGYNEIFTGYPDPKVRFNNHPDNANTNVLEFLNRQKDFEKRVAAFTSWTAFDRILNEKRSGFPVNAGLELVETNLNEQPLSEMQKQLNETMSSSRSLAQALGKANPGRSDAMTYQVAREFLKVNQPRVLYISFGATDSFAHAGKYNQSLLSREGS